MRLKRHVSLLESSLKHVSPRPLISSQCNRYRYASSASHPEQIAILGGGISGLASAHFISKEFPKSKITVFESGEEAGGWIKSRRIDVKGRSVLFEYGPRTLRPGPQALATAQLIADLDLIPDVLTTSADSPAAKNRYIYYPDRLNRLPAPGSNFTFFDGLKLYNSGLINGLWNAIQEFWRPRRPSGLQDESVGDFISRRIDKRVADNMLSAVMHGIYAGDIYQLSAKTLLSKLWQLEGRYGSMFRGFMRLNGESQSNDFLTLWHPSDWEEYRATKEEIEKVYPDAQFLDKLAPSKTSTFTFKEGLQQLVLKLEQSLIKNPQVDIQTQSSVQSFGKAKDASGRIEVVAGSDSSAAPRKFDFVVSTLPQPGLTGSVTVMVVNLYYSQPDLIPVRGFGYLIPRSVPFVQNPERALGVIFDHDAVSGQDSAPGTKLTVMLGGHWWNGWDGYPDSDEGADLAKSVVRRHLGIDVEPEACHVSLNKNCIPQYTVGYEQRLKDFAVELQDMYNGRFRVVGSQFNGVGVNDCIKGAWNLARSMRGNGWRQRSVGIDRALDERPWISEHPARIRRPLKTSSDGGN